MYAALRSQETSTDHAPPSIVFRSEPNWSAKFENGGGDVIMVLYTHGGDDDQSKTISTA